MSVREGARLKMFIFKGEDAHSKGILIQVFTVGAQFVFQILLFGEACINVETSEKSYQAAFCKAIVCRQFFSNSSL